MLKLVPAYHKKKILIITRIITPIYWRRPSHYILINYRQLFLAKTVRPVVCWRS